MVAVEQLHKRFGKLEVLKGVDLELEPGKVHVIMGPNGSGKTTLIKCILGLVRPDRGNIKISGKRVNGLWKYRKDIGYMPQIAHFPENLTPKELINLVQDIRGEAHDWKPLQEELKLAPHWNKPVRNLSGGTRQKVNALMALLFGAPILILDEPTVGLDPVARLWMKDRIIEECKKGKTVILTTHVMAEIEELAARIVFLMDGKIHFIATPAEIKAKHPSGNLERAIAHILEEAETA